MAFSAEACATRVEARRGLRLRLLRTFDYHEFCGSCLHSNGRQAKSLLNLFCHPFFGLNHFAKRRGFT